MNTVIGLIGGLSGCALASEIHKHGLKVAAVIGRPEEPGFDIADYVLVCDLSNHDKIIKYFKTLGVSDVILGTGPYVAIGLSYSLIEAGFQLNVDLEKFELCKNKFALNELMRQNGVRTPKDRIIRRGDDLISASEELNFPIVVKSIRDIVEPAKIMDADSFLETAQGMLQNEESIMAEEYIAGNDITVFVCNSDELFMRPIYWSKGLEEKLKGFVDSYSKPLDEDEEERLFEYCRRVNDIVNISGSYRIDLIYGNGEFYFLEINTLLVSSLASSSYMIKFFWAGVNRARYIVEFALKKFGISTVREKKRLYITDDDYIVNSSDSNRLYVTVSGLRQIYKNDVDDSGINLFYSYLDENEVMSKWDKTRMKNIFACIVSADAEEVCTVDMEPESETVKMIRSVCDFLKIRYCMVKREDCLI